MICSVNPSLVLLLLTVRPTAVSPEMGGAVVVDGGSGGVSPDPSPTSSTMGAPSSSSDVSVQAPSGLADLSGQRQEDLDIQNHNLPLLRREGKGRTRKHFTGKQMDVLLREIKAPHNRLYGESQNPLRCGDRRQAWEAVAAAINRARCSPTKTAVACCKRFGDLKRRRKARLGTRMPSMRQDGPIITATFSHASPMGIHILPSVNIHTHTQSTENTVTGEDRQKTCCFSVCLFVCLCVCDSGSGLNDFYSRCLSQIQGCKEILFSRAYGY